MSSYTISATLNKSRVFILQNSELEKRLDPQFYKQEYKDNLEKIKRINHKRLGEVVKFSSETWNQKDFFENSFPYIEISEIDTISGQIQNIVQVDKEKAASRAKMIVRENDIIISTTRPNRGAISLIRKEQDFSIASTGFSVIRNITNPEIDREYLFTILRQQIILKQFEQRSSGGNYPAITQEELCSVTIPLPEREIQKKIVKVFNDCFTQKQKNEAEAGKLLSSIDDYLLMELGIKLPEIPENTLKNRMFVANINAVSGNRFDPFFHQAYFFEIENAIKSSKFKTDILRNQLSFIESGSRPKGGATRDDKGVLSIGGEHVNSFCEVEVRTAKYIPLEFHQSILSTETKLNDILFVKDGATTGKVGMINKSDYTGQNINEHVFLLRPISSINAFYLVNYLNSKVAQILIKKLIAGATVTGITKDALKSLPIPVPPLNKQKEIAVHITNIRQQVQQLKDKTASLLRKASEEIEEILLN